MKTLRTKLILLAIVTVMFTTFVAYSISLIFPLIPDCIIWDIDTTEGPKRPTIIRSRNQGN